VSISLLSVKRKPKRWAAEAIFFDSGHAGVILHAQCFAHNVRMLSACLFPDGASPPQKRTESAEFPMWVDI
jgi:hypothetical protein